MKLTRLLGAMAAVAVLALSIPTAFAANDPALVAAPASDQMILGVLPDLDLGVALTAIDDVELIAFLGFGAHNVTAVDNPEIANCTLFGPNAYASNPSCETVRNSSTASIYSGSGGGPACPVGDIVLTEKPLVCAPAVPI